MIIGTCSICGGAVTTPDVWGGVIPPTPTCTKCGAVAANHGPIIPMVKPTEDGVWYRIGNIAGKESTQ